MTAEILFACVVAIVLPWRAWRRYVRHAPPVPPVRYVAETAILTGVLAALLWRRDVPLDALGLQPTVPLRFLVDLAICVGVVVGLDVWSVWCTTRRLRRAAVDQALRAAASEGPGGTYAEVVAARRALGAFVAVAIVGAVWEELCFRATVFLLLPRTAAGLALGVVAGSLLFGAQHLRNGRMGVAYSSLFGVMFSLLYLATGNLVAVMIAHAMGNILAVSQWAPRIERARQAALGGSPVFLG